MNYNVGEHVYIEGVNKNGKGGIIVEPSDFVNILESGYMITDNIVNSYMNLLVHSEKYELSIVSSFFLQLLQLDGWERTKQHIQNWEKTIYYSFLHLEDHIIQDIGTI